MKAGDIYLIWYPGDIQRQAWYYLHHKNKQPVFVDSWPYLASDPSLTRCGGGLLWEFMFSPDHDYYFLEDDNGKG